MDKIIIEGNINGIAIEHIVRDSSFYMPTKHMHNEYEIYYLYEGSRYYFIDSQTHLIEPGTLVIIDKQQIHKTSPTDTDYHNRLLIEFHEEAMSILEGLGGSMSLSDFFKNYQGILKLDENNKHLIESQLTSITEELNELGDFFEQAIQLKVAQLIFSIARIANNTKSLSQSKNPSSKHQKVNEISNYIVHHSHGPLSLDDIASNFYLNKSYVSRIYKEITGFTVNEYINITKIKEARKFLDNTELSISEIASILGYGSLTYFERIFKKHTETTPMRYRKKRRQLDKPLRERL